MAKSLLRTDNEIAEIYSRRIDTIYRICYAYMKNPADSEDAVSETFLRLMKYAPAFNDSEHEKAWLIRTASNVCKNILKHWSRKNEDISAHSDALKSEDNFDGNSLFEVVCNLPEKYKLVIDLYYYEGYSSVEIAKILKKPQSTIRNYLHEARNILRERLHYEE